MDDLRKQCYANEYLPSIIIIRNGGPNDLVLNLFMTSILFMLFIPTYSLSNSLKQSYLRRYGRYIKLLYDYVQFQCFAPLRNFLETPYGLILIVNFFGVSLD